MQSFKRKVNVIFRLLIPGLVILLFVILFWGSFPSGSSKSYDPSIFHKRQGWIEYSDNPVLPDEAHSEATGTIFDLVLLQENMTSSNIPADLYFRDPVAKPVDTALTWRMWSSWRPSQAIAYSTSLDGKTWDQNLQISLGRNDTGWEDHVNRPFVKKIATGKYAMWYTGQHTEVGVGGRIGYAESADGIRFDRTQAEPVLLPTLPWEQSTDSYASGLYAVMTPTIVDLPNDVLRMYYAAGESYEPDAIGVAHSYDGGLKHGDPIFKPDRNSGEVGVWWDSHKVTSPHVIRGEDDYFYMFYAGFRNIDYSSVGVARSRNGLTDWEQHIGNPIVDIREGAWNCNAVYKPFVGWSEAQQEWLLWYNGRCGGLERIGLSTLKAKSFGEFVKRG